MQCARCALYIPVATCFSKKTTSTQLCSSTVRALQQHRNSTANVLPAKHTVHELDCSIPSTCVPLVPHSALERYIEPDLSQP